MNSLDFLNFFSQERPVGTPSNGVVLDFFEKEFYSVGYEVESLPFNCMCWEKDKSFFQINDKAFEIFPSPFSKPFEGNAEISIIRSIEDLQNLMCKDKIVILCDDIAKEPIQPKDFPFYYPDEHKNLITLLEKQSPKAIICATGKHPLCGLNPFPMFEDGNFMIPSAYMSKVLLKNCKQLDLPASVYKLSIKSKNSSVCSRQIIAVKKAQKQAIGKIIVCAHMDSKYNTPGAIDNAAGVTVVMNIMKGLNQFSCDYNIDFVLFNSEEYFGVNGQLEYLGYIKSRQDNISLVINLDSPCHINSKTAISLYNASERITAIIQSQLTTRGKIIEGDQWYAGDHAMFVSQGIPCIAVTSSNLFETVLGLTHTQSDTTNNISIDLVKDTSEFLIELIQSFAN